MLLDLLRRWWMSLALYAVVAVGIAGILLGFRQAGKLAERDASAKKTLNAVRVRHEVERDIDSADAAELDRLRKKWTKRD